MPTEPNTSMLIGDEIFEDSISAMERSRLLQKAGQDAADIINDVEADGPLSQYVKARRLEAAEALRVLAEIDPESAVQIATAQASVREYLRVCEWVHQRLEAADEAEREIKEEYGE